VSMVWPCSLSVDEYAQAGRAVEFPRLDCASCSRRLGFWSGYWRDVRAGGRCWRIWVRRARCASCEVSHALLPAFVLVGRLDVVESVGAVIERVAAGPVGVRPAAEGVAVPYTTARGWWRRFASCAERLAVAFAALAVELGGQMLAPAVEVECWALDAIRASWEAALSLPGWAAMSLWRFVSAVSGGRLVAANTDSPWLIVGKRRFMPPVP
jgi:hypothetical protein